MLSRGEQEAERLYELYRAGRMGERSLLANFWCLERESKLGALYFVWLLKRSVEYEVCD